VLHDNTQDMAVLRHVDISRSITRVAKVRIAGCQCQSV
jgi:hypothetical protein